MQLSPELDLVLNPDEKTQLARILRVPENDLPDALTPVISAALQEYVRMFLGQKVFTRGSDMREYRLFLLIRELFERTIPDEERVSALFQTTETQSRSLIRSVLSKYQYEVSDALRASLTKVVYDAVQPEEGSDYEVSIQNDSLVERPESRAGGAGWLIATSVEEAKYGLDLSDQAVFVRRPPGKLEPRGLSNGRSSLGRVLALGAYGHDLRSVVF